MKASVEWRFCLEQQVRFYDRIESLDLVKVRGFLQINFEFVYGIEGIEISLKGDEGVPIFDLSRR